MPRKRTLTKSKKKCWKAFSKYIRERDNNTCVTCGREAEGSGMHAGHYIPSAVGGLKLRYNEQNVHAQCYHCNINLSGNWPSYRDFILRKYGEEVDTELQKMKCETSEPWAIEDYEIKAEEYKEKLKSLSR